MTSEELEKLYRRHNLNLAMFSIFDVIGMGGLVGGIILLAVDQILIGAIVTTLSALLVISCTAALGRLGVSKAKLKKYMKLRGIASTANPYIALRDDLLLQSSF